MPPNGNPESLREIGQRPTLTRQVIGLAQNEFCQRARIAPTTYNQFDKGRQRPAVENAIALCETYGITLDWIYRGDLSGLRFDMATATKTLARVRG